MRPRAVGSRLGLCGARGAVLCGSKALIALERNRSEGEIANVRELEREPPTVPMDTSGSKYWKQAMYGTKLTSSAEYKRHEVGVQHKCHCTT
jgi:hypothetical protein